MPCSLFCRSCFSNVEAAAYPSSDEEIMEEWVTCVRVSVRTVGSTLTSGGGALDFGLLFFSFSFVS